MKKSILLIFLLATATLSTQAQTFTSLATDPGTDAVPVPGLLYLDATGLGYSYDKATDVITFKLSVQTVMSTNYGINIMLDVDGVTATKKKWWGKQNSSFMYNVLLTAWIDSDPSTSTSSFDIKDSDGKILAAKSDLTMKLDPASNSYLISVARTKIATGAKLTAKVVAAAGSNMGWADDIPNTGSGSLTADPNAGGTTSVGTMNIVFNDFAVYPNPSTNGIFTVEKTVSETATISIYNVMGAKVYSTTTNDDKMIVDLSNQPAGNYFVKVGAGNKAATQTIIIQ